VWRIATRAGIALTAGRRTMGRPLPPERRAQVEQAVTANPGATQQELAQRCGVSRSTVGRVTRARRATPAPAE
jgi:transcriptional regulator with XRE-family HTH domain